ncbi:MAG: alpha/beta hydrolase [Deltaproteobacteria bacterium]|nr:alpha/beta hydrolase [Deltaproteobacteria bacterium]
MENAKFVSVNGFKTRYFEGGSGETLVLISGGSFGSYYSADHWSLNFDDLGKHFHVYAFDKLGMGYTDNPNSDADYTMSAVIDHAGAFLRAMGIERATLMGHSRGALPAARIAVDHPEIVKALIILPSSTLPAEDPSVPADFYKKIDAAVPPIPDRKYVRWEPEANSFSKDHITEDFVDAMLKIALLPKTMEAKKKMAFLSDTVFVPDARKRKYETLELIKAGRLRAPTLIVWGLNDPSAPVKLGLDLVRLIGSVVDRTRFHVINHAGHYVFREHPGELHRLIIDFVR